MAEMGGPQLGEVDDLGRILFCDDPELRLDDVLIELDTEERTLTLDPAQSHDVPAALFDFRVAVGAGGSFPYAATRTSPVDDELRDPRIGVALRGGMTLLPPGFGEPRVPYRPRSGNDLVDLVMRRMSLGDADLRSIPGWELHATPEDPPGAWARTHSAYDRLELRMPDGAPYSRIWVPHDAEWQAAALGYGHVVCLCGVELGIRAPYAMSDAQYTPRMRHAHFRRACVAGLAVGGLVPYVDHR